MNSSEQNSSFAYQFSEKQQRISKNETQNIYYF